MAVGSSPTAGALVAAGEVLADFLAWGIDPVMSNTGDAPGALNKEGRPLAAPGRIRPADGAAVAVGGEIGGAASACPGAFWSAAGLVEPVASGSSAC